MPRLLLLLFLTIAVGVPVELKFLRTPSCAYPEPSWLWCTGFESGESLADVRIFHGEITHEDAAGRNHHGALRLGGGPVGGGITWALCDGAEPACSPRQFQRLHVRAWVRLHPRFEGLRHFIEVGGRDRLHPYGSAGCRPNGVNEYMTFADLDRQLRPLLYTYHQDMRCDGRCGRYANVEARCDRCAAIGFPTCEVRPQCCWGQAYRPLRQPEPLGRDAWHCVEVALRVNTPGVPDGSQSLWIDDRPIVAARGLRWTSTADLGVTYVRLQQYIEAGDVEEPLPIWLDDVVVSTRPIGCGG